MRDFQPESWGQLSVQGDPYVVDDTSTVLLYSTVLHIPYLPYHDKVQCRIRISYRTKVRSTVCNLRYLVRSFEPIVAP